MDKLNLDINFYSALVSGKAFCTENEAIPCFHLDILTSRRSMQKNPYSKKFPKSRDIVRNENRTELKYFSSREIKMQNENEITNLERSKL